MANNDTKVTITGATGHIGHVAAQELLKKGVAVRAIGRSAAKLKSLKEAGSEIFEASVDDATAMAKVFAGSSAVFLLIPPNMTAPDNRAWQKKVGEAYVQAIAKAGVPHVVFLSSIGGHLAQGTGPIQGLHLLEERLKALPAAITVECLRPVFFMENHLFGIPVIQGMNILGGPLKGDVAIAQIATRDIGLYAAERLLAPVKGWTTTELFGPRDYSMNDSAKILGAAIGKPDLKWVQFSPADARKGMEGMGMSPSVVADFLEMYASFNAGAVRPQNDRAKSPKTKTTLEEFARTTFKEAFGAGVAAAH